MMPYFKRKRTQPRQGILHFKTILGRLIATYLTIVTLVVVLVSILSFNVLKWSATQNSMESLNLAVSAIDEVLSSYFWQGKNDGSFMKNLKFIAAYNKLDIWVVDHFDIIQIDISGSPELAANEQLLLENKEKMLEPSLNGNTEVRTLYGDDFFHTPILSVSSPLSINKENITTVVFVHKKLTEVTSQLELLFGQIMLGGAIAAVITVMLVILSAKGIGKPLNEINLAARELARGNFKKRLNISDENEIGQLADTFNLMAIELEKYETTRSSFVANVSHELKSPLTSIQGFVQAMLDDTIEEEDKRQYLEIVLSEVKRLNLLIGDLLDLAKIESGQFPLNYKEWDINELIRRCIISFVTKIENKSLDVSANIPEEKNLVWADQDRITQVITNLLDNAVKFCEVGGTIKLWVHKSGEVTNVAISNSGETIPESDIPFVFDRFFKVDRSHNRKAKGTGIGLSIVRNIIIQHGEQIWVNSKPGTGTVFTFTLSSPEKKLKPAAIKTGK